VSLRRALALVSVAGVSLACFAASAQASVLGPRAAHSPNAEDIRTAYWIALVVATVLLVAVLASVIVAVLRFRARRGWTPRPTIAGRGVFLRAGIPLAVVAAGLIVFGIVETDRARDVAPSGPAGLSASRSLTAQVGGDLPADAGKPLEIRVVGQQWLWRFDYPSGDQTASSGTQTAGPPYDVFSFNELVVPVDTTVILDVTSIDVMHRWFIPALGGQVDAVPGQSNKTWFRADRTGVYPGQSTAYSGAGYAAMRAWVHVVTPEQYKAFLSDKQRDIEASQKYAQDNIQTEEAR
jgi:cytochrome c oxidase subunit II